MSSSQPVERRLVTLSGKLAFCRYGPERGATAPWLAIHGWQDNAASFAPLAAELPQQTIYALDLPGHGLSDPIGKGAAYTFLDWVVAVDDALAGLMDMTGAQTVTMVGHSLGGALGLVVAGVRPSLVGRVATIDGFAPRTQEADEAQVRLSEYLANRRRRPSRRRRAYATLDEAAERLASLPGAPALEACRVLAERGTEPTADGLRWRRDPRIMDGPLARLPRAQIHSYLSAVRAPVDVLRPADGWPFPTEWREWLRAAIPQANIHDLPGGHHVHMEDPAGVAARLVELGLLRA